MVEDVLESQRRGLKILTILFMFFLIWFQSGEDPAIAHNRYPEMWAELNREFIEEWEQERYKSIKEQAKLNPPMTSSVVKESVTKCAGGEDIFDDDDDDDDEEGEEKLVFFMRAGYRGSPRWATLFWAGDQMVSWQRHDGIKSAVTALLTSGLSGYAFNHSDIGGYCTVDLPFMHYQRTEELLLRWMELNAFSVIFRTHEVYNTLTSLCNITLSLIFRNPRDRMCSFSV